MKQSETIKKLFESLVKAQSCFCTLPKDKTGYGYKYTDFDTVVSYIRPILASNGLGFTQTLTMLENGKNALTTRVFNADGEYIEDTTALPDVAMAKTNAAQNMGASITYMKRYALCSVLGISSDEDTDAVTEKPQIQQNTKSQPAPKTEAKPQQKGGEATAKEKALIKELLKSTYPDGTVIFNSDEIKGFSASRINYTAGEVINNIKAEKEKRLSKVLPKEVNQVRKAVDGNVVQEEIF